MCINLKFIKTGYATDAIIPFVAPSVEWLQNKGKCYRITVHTDLIPSRNTGKTASAVDIANWFALQAYS